MLTVHQGGDSPPRPGAYEEAWGIVMDAFAAALRVEGLHPDEQARFLRRHRLAAEVAGRRVVEGA